MWNIEKIVKKGDYQYAVVKDHPRATRYGYVLLHRVLMENHLDRLLDADEVVHHKDGNGLNNDLNNLELMKSAEHSRMHSSSGRTTVELVCPVCGKLFEREKRQIYGVKAPTCSRHCNGKRYSVNLGPSNRKSGDDYIGGTRISETDDNPEQTVDNRMRRGHTSST